MNIRQIFFLKHILILAGFAGFLGLVRFWMTSYDSYLWLNWNLLLALIPLLFAWLAITSSHRWISVIMVVIWLGFLPNAPYLITDFIHLADVGPKSGLWFDALMIFIYSLAGLFSWVLSLDMLAKYFSWKWWLISVISLLSGFGIYLGRYLRLNTWHIITNPLEFFEHIGLIIINPTEHEPVVLMTVTFALTLLLMYSYMKPLLSHEKTAD